MPAFTVTDDFSVCAGFYAMYRNRQSNIAPWQYIADISAVYRTRVGPASLSLTKYGLANWNNLYLAFNFGYLIFAPKGTFY